MPNISIISAQKLLEQIDNPDLIIFDCRFSLADTDAGHRNYRQSHIPGAHYVDLNKDLSSPIRDYTGRHPLPDFRVLTKKLSSWGVHNRKQVVVYDDKCGGFAARMWWLLRIMGHENVAVLDGGFSFWLTHKFPTTTSLPKTNKSTSYRTYLDKNQWLEALDIENGLATNLILLIDARTSERFTGLKEPIDPIAGHVPKAKNLPFQHNFDSNGLFLKPDILREQFLNITKSTEPSKVVHMCGSGITAIFNLLAMEVAGLHGSKLYAGSWSEWITNKNRAVATGS
jgi:thiosulfate/3-mercaptopyruvate sulfurtransferase